MAGELGSVSVAVLCHKIIVLRSCLCCNHSGYLLSTTSLGWHLLGSGLHPTECDREAVGSLPEALGHFSGGDVGPLGPERSTVLGRRLSARPLVEWGTQKCRRHGNSPA